jgi:aspartate racemase
MNKIGIIGGLGPQASIYLYQKIMEIAMNEFGAKTGSDFPEITIINLPVPELIDSTVNIEDQETCIGMINQAIFNFSLSGLNQIYIACNTIHLYEDLFEIPSKMNFISLPKLIGNVIDVNNCIVLGSKNTIKSQLYPSDIALCDSDTDELDTYIKLVIQDRPEADLKRKFMDYLNKVSLKYNRNDILLACTELPTLIDNRCKKSYNVISCTEIQARKICQEYYLNFN